MSKLVSLLLLLFTINNIYTLNKYNVLYLNSGNGNNSIEKEILFGIEETLSESKNINLLFENLDLFQISSNNIYRLTSDLIIEKYKNIDFDLIILLNSNSKIFYNNFLKNKIETKNTLYIDFTSNQIPIDPYIDHTISNIYFNPQLEKIIMNMLQLKKFNKLYILKRNWETIPQINIDNISIEIINVNRDTSNLTFLDELIYFTPYTMDKIIDFPGNYPLTSWYTKGILGGILNDPVLFGNRIAYVGKLKILGIDTKNTIETYESESITLNYDFTSKISEYKIDGAKYINLPLNKYEKDPTLVYRNVIFILIILFLTIIILIVIINRFLRNKLLHDSKEQLYTLINVLPLPIHARDSKGKYLFVNDTFLSTNHIKQRKDIINLSINNTPGLSPEEIKIFLKQDLEVLECQETKIYETIFYDTKTQEHKVYKVYKTPLKYYEKESVLCVLDDVSELKAAENQVIELNKTLEKKIKQRTIDLEKSIKELQQTQNELVETKKMASLTTLVSGIAHEMNTPLGITLTQTTYLFDMTHEIFNDFNNNKLRKTQLKNYIMKSLSSEELLINSLKRTIKMVNRFKEVAVQKNDFPEKFNLYLMLHQQIRIYAMNYKRNDIDLSINMDKEIEVITYKEALVTIIENLIDNSYNHAFKNNNGKISIKCSLDRNNILIYYEDNGKGVDKEQLDRLFDPFYTTNRDQGQIGLGLSIVYATIKNKLKGKIDYYIPKDSKGLGFKITLTDSIA